MKIAIASDLHLEFGDLDFDNSDGADVLILSGDICVAADLDMRDSRQTEMGFARARSERFHEFFERCATRFPHVIYVMGNHEYYHSDLATELNEVRRKLAHLSNLYVLEREVKVISDITFIGGTLWTDMNNLDALTLYHMRTMMNDFRVIKNTATPVHFRTQEGEFKTRVGKFSPEDAVAEHVKMKQYIQSVVQGNHGTKYVVVGHHAPSHLSIHPRYGNDQIMNGGYYSNLDEFILDRPQIKLWTHGHTHHPFDYVIGETRVVCNPRGYIGHEPEADSWQLKTVEI
jgi:predicted phosphodiesterase